MEYFAFLFLAGIVGGFIGGLLGIGGGIIYIVVIPLVLTGIGVPREQIVQYTIANSVFASFFSSLSANFVLIKNNNFYPKEVLIMSFVGIITALLLLHYVVNTTWYSKETFNIVIVVLLAYMLLKLILATFNSNKQEAQENKKADIKLGLAGLVGGSVSALSGMGGGVVIIPILHSLFHMDIKKANAISLGVIGLTSFVMSAFSMFENTHTSFRYYSLGYIIFPVAFSLTAGVIIASPLGVKASRTVSPQTLTHLFCLFLAIIIIRKIIEITSY